MDDPNITMEEYISLKEEKARRHGQTFNWQTATFGKVKNYEDEDDYPIDFETEFPVIVFDNILTAIPSESKVCPPNENELDFRISLDESDDEDYTVIFDENSFSYKIIYVNDLIKTNSGNDKPLSPNPTVDYFDDLDYFKDLENEFPAIVYNDGLMSKSDLGVKPLINSECIDELNLINETSLSEYDEEISSEDNEITHGENGFSETSHDKIIKTFETGSFVINLNIVLQGWFSYKHYGGQDMAPLPTADQRHPWLRYQIDEYTKEIRRSYEQRLETIWSRPVNRVHVLDFEGLTAEMRMSDTIIDLDTVDTLCFQLGGVRRRMTLRQFILALGLHTEHEMISSDREFLGLAPFYVLIRDPMRRLCHKMLAYSILGRGQAPEKVTDVDLFYLRSMDHGTANVPHLLAQYLFRHAEGRKRGARLSGGHFIRRLAMHFRLVSDKGLRGLQVVTLELPLIDLHELGRLHICTRYGNTWAWVAQGPETQQAAAAGALEANEAG
ncbi:hypothetical protein Tco_1384043 [Tanacetum coccineum]